MQEKGGLQMKHYFEFKTLRKRYKLLIFLMILVLISQWYGGFFDEIGMMTILLHEGTLILAFIAGTLIADWIDIFKNKHEV